MTIRCSPGGASSRSWTRTTYLVSHSLGAMPRGVPGSTRRVRRGLGDARRARLGRGLVGDAGHASATSSAASSARRRASVVDAPERLGLPGMILSCFDFSGRRNKIVYEDAQLPVGDVRVRGARARAGRARRRWCPSDDGITVRLERMLDAIDEETLLVADLARASSGALRPGRAAIIARAPTQVGALVVARPLPVGRHACRSTSRPGRRLRHRRLGEVAVRRAGRRLPVRARRDLHEQLEPRAHRLDGARAPVRLRARPDRYARGRARFLHGTPAVPALYAARAGYEIVRRGRRRARSARSRKRQVQLLVERARGHGFASRTPADPEQRGGMVVARRARRQQAVARELLRRDILVDYRPGAGIRCRRTSTRPTTRAASMPSTRSRASCDSGALPAPTSGRASHRDSDRRDVRAPQQSRPRRTPWPPPHATGVRRARVLQHVEST